MKLPTGLNPKEAGPLFCAGITVFNPLIQHEILPTATVGVIGIGGLGHLAVKFLRAWGCEVIAFTSSESKKKQALELGAHQTIDSRDSRAIQSVDGKLDLVLSTVNVNMDWNTYLGTLKPTGGLHFVGVVLEALELNMLQLLFGQRSVSSSSVGSPATIARMLEFAGRHQIEPITEHYPMSAVNTALDHLRSGKAHYRIVLDADF